MATVTALSVEPDDSRTKSTGDITNANFPKDGEGRVYHLRLKATEIANRILLVGDPERAVLIVKKCFDDPTHCFTHKSNRGFETYTGTFKGEAVTVMSIGMGIAMMDFALREIRAITTGHLDIIRLGSCGTPHKKVEISAVVVAKVSYGVFTNHDAFHDKGSKEKHYRITKPLPPDPRLHQLLLGALQKNSADNFPVVEAPDATADTFYGSQGRIDPEFMDHNESLIEDILKEHPETGSLQMETYEMFHLSRLNEYANETSMMRVAACAIVLAQRHSNAFLPDARKHEIEEISGRACLEALTYKV